MEIKENGSYKYTELADVLRAKIQTEASGTRLPSVRALMKRHAVSMQTVILAVKILEEENLIVRRHGSGIYVSDKRSIRFIVYHRSRHPSRNNDAKEVTLLKAIQAAGWYLAVRRHDTEEGTLVSPEPKACAHIVNQDVVLPGMPFLDQIIKQKVPIIFMGREPGEHEVDYVTGDDRRFLLTLVKHFVQLGHKRFGFLVNEPPMFEVLQREKFFKDILASLKLPPPTVIDCQTKWGEHGATKAYTGLQNFLQQCGKKLPFTALITASEDAGVAALRAFHDNNYQIPKQCSLATFGCKIENEWSIPSITDVGSLPEDTGKHVVRILKDRFKGDLSPGFGIHMPCRIQIRESSAPPPSKTK
ncbi:GntR family transcriptional regulator [Coraliomargarita parva]|uniref:GntR family transcriptional regulator n=1 Tax=Coraliomargarita parva TaxID=3014050 RepID=UPI0022B38E83|nr:GntR family transcriptional regulator [Coraliomargarita parva]